MLLPSFISPPMLSLPYLSHEWHVIVSVKAVHKWLSCNSRVSHSLRAINSGVKSLAYYSLFNANLIFVLYCNNWKKKGHIITLQPTKNGVLLFMRSIFILNSRLSRVWPSVSILKSLMKWECKLKGKPTILSSINPPPPMFSPP